MKGFVQVYTGDGKGKTTAALGLSLRAAGAGLKVFITQFIKMGDYSEIKALHRFSDLITVEQYGLGRFIKGDPSIDDISAARKGLEKVHAVLLGAKHDVVIMEEANVAVMCGLFSVDDILGLIAIKPESVELIITGRGADPRIVKIADIVTEMKCIKHNYNRGFEARIGIEK
jgi:cob(I)alamin adenosyltransferase